MGMSQDADLGWGIVLVDDEFGETHESIAEYDFWKLESKDEYKNLIEVVYAGHCDYSYPVVMLERSKAHAYWGHAEVESDLTPPSSDEKTLIDKFLDEAGYTGPREIKLLLVASYG